MTQEEIIEMPPYLNASYEGDDLYTGDQVRELMKLVAAKEREACAKVCETFEIPKKILGAHPDYLEGKHMAVFQCAAAIRARGEQA